MTTDNRKRLDAWRVRWFYAFGVIPADPPGRRPAHCNCHVFKFPHRRGQFRGADLATPKPEET